MQDRIEIFVFKIVDFRKWLKKNSKRESKVTIILHKKHTGKSAPSHREQIEEAICFGWIDTTVKRRDEDTFFRNFSRRSVKSKWSKNTLSYAERLHSEGRMTEEGLHFFKLGKAKPTLDHGIPKAPQMPIELKKGLNKNIKAKTNFDKFPPSTKRMFYRWILSAKQPQTRLSRVKRVLQSANANKRSF